MGPILPGIISDWSMPEDFDAAARACCTMSGLMVVWFWKRLLGFLLISLDFAGALFGGFVLMVVKVSRVGVLLGSWPPTDRLEG